MRAIPDRLAVLDRSRTRLGYITRADTASLTEADCDRLIVDHLDLVAETLRNAGILGESSGLVLLGRQVRRVDVLCAERDLVTDELLRLVLIEDKLFRNPEAHRKVVAQILDYASELRALGASALIEELDPAARDWIEDQVPRLQSLLATGDCLLLIAGDEIRPRVVRLVERMARDRDPLSHTDVALLSLGLFQHDDGFLLLPNVVGGAVGAQRELRVHVEVSAGDLPLTIERVGLVDSGADAAAQRAEAREFFETAAWRAHPEDAKRAQQLFDDVAAAGIPGLRVGTLESGRPVVHLEGTRVGRLKVLAAAEARRAIWDTLVGHEARKVETDAEASRAVHAFRKRLVELGFQQHPSGRAEADMGIVDRQRAVIVDAVRKLARDIGRT